MVDYRKVGNCLYWGVPGYHAFCCTRRLWKPHIPKAHVYDTCRQAHFLGNTGLHVATTPLACPAHATQHHHPQQQPHMEHTESPVPNSCGEPTLAGPVSVAASRKRAGPSSTDVSDSGQTKKVCIRNESTDPPNDKTIDFTHPDYADYSRRPIVLSDLVAIARELPTRRSIAIATGFMSPVKLSQLDPIGAAKVAMSYDERRWWSAIQAGANLELPTIDWTTARLEVVPASKKRLTRRANALATLYPTDVVDAENALWFTLEYEEFRPLVKVVDRMQAAMRVTERSPQATYDAMVRAEIACLRHVGNTATAALVADIDAFEGKALGMMDSVSAIQKNRTKALKDMDAHLEALGVMPQHRLFDATEELYCLSRTLDGCTDVMKGDASEMAQRSDGKVEAIMAIWNRVEELEGKVSI